MRNLRSLVLAGAGLAVVMAGTAFARDAMHDMTVRLPDGSIEHIRYLGDQPPKVSYDTRSDRILVPVFDDGLAADPFAAIEQISAAMDLQAARMMQAFDHAAPLTAPLAAAGPGLLTVDMSHLPPGVQGYSVYSVTSGGKTCSQAIRYLNDGSGAPKVEKTASGNCDAIAPSVSPRTVRLAPAVPAAPQPAAPVQTAPSNGRNGNIIEASIAADRTGVPAQRLLRSF
ncbi:hypothetical protein [Rhizobium straminoryzae]|uniref:DUF2259 domain-containing protein n=1 Tax=Rhizobium straminoryzae TaxID=1387186 RepID=A0A549T9L7_9HYPH|nr:hypothetical protein [Rhizobium straminoryzae]TRL38546.1 hypothetical protein FNA46_12470 [Rhizobium straminoryzae]